MSSQARHPREWSQESTSSQSPNLISGNRCDAYLWCHVAANTSWERECLEELLETFNVFTLVRVNLAVDAFQVEVGDESGCAVARAGDDEGIEVILLDQSVHMDVTGAASVRNSAFQCLSGELT